MYKKDNGHRQRPQNKSAYLNSIFRMRDNPDYLDRLPGLWNELPGWQNNSHQLVKILSNASELIANNPDHPESARSKRHLTNNFGVWEKQALRYVLSFDNEELSDTLSSIARLDICPGALFMENWQERALNPLIIFSAKDIEKIREADEKLNLNLPREIYLSKPAFLLANTSFDAQPI